MKIDYPKIEWEDVRPGDTVLRQWNREDLGLTRYVEFIVDGESEDPDPSCTHYLIDRPKKKFPEEYGAIIIAKKVRGVEFPDGIALMRHRGNAYGYSHTKPQWKSIGQQVKRMDNHGETHIEDWVLGKIVPV